MSDKVTSSEGAPSAPAAAAAAAAATTATTATTAVADPAPATTASPPQQHPELLPGTHWAELAPADGADADDNDDNDNDDADSALGSDAASSTASLSSSIVKYRTIQGRTYHGELGDAQYWGTVDEKHLNSMDLNHHIFTLTLDDKLFLAPIKNPKKVLDVGTGTGIWAIDFAGEHPDVEVIATDVAPVQPTWVPPNVKFEIEDCTQPWTFAPNTFDYVHIRYLVGCIRDWDALFAEAYRVLAPGGYIESHEISLNILSDDATLPPDSAVAQWGPIFFAGGERTGRTFRVIEDDLQTKALKRAGFVDLQQRDYKSPSGAWPKDQRLKEIGLLNEVLGTSDLEGFVNFVTNVLGWTEAEVAALTAHIRRQVRVEKPHIYYPMRVVYARKPE